MMKWGAGQSLEPESLNCFISRSRNYVIENDSKARQNLRKENRESRRKNCRRPNFFPNQNCPNFQLPAGQSFFFFFRVVVVVVAVEFRLSLYTPSSPLNPDFFSSHHDRRNIGGGAENFAASIWAFFQIECISGLV